MPLLQKTNSKTQKQVNKYISRVDMYFEVDIQDISVGTTYAAFLALKLDMQSGEIKLRETTS